MRVGVDADFVHRAGALACEGVELGDGLKLFAKEGELPGAVFEVGGKDFEAIAAHPERATLKGLVVAAVLLGDEFGHDGALVVFLADLVKSYCPTVSFLN